MALLTNDTENTRWRDKEQRRMQFESWLDQYYFERYILEVSIATLERGGVTSKVDTYQFLTPIDAWGLPKYPGKTVVLPPGANIAKELIRFIKANDAYLYEPDAWLGTWIDPATKCCYLDITVIYPTLEEAKREASERSVQESRNIVAVYNFKHDRTVYLRS